MSQLHLVRVGLLGSVGRFQASGAERFERGARVVCQTDRGLEVGEVLAALALGEDISRADGQLLRGLTSEDDMLLERLTRHKEEAFTACERLLREANLEATLMDVEHLFDGRSLYFYFLGQTPPEVELLTAQLAQTYEAQVQFREFSETLAQGCGPDCGVGEKEDCGDGCISCHIAAACPSKN